MRFVGLRAGLLAGFVAILCLEHCQAQGPLTDESLRQLFGFDLVHGKLNKQILEPIDLFLEDILPTWFGQAPNNENGTRPEFQDYAMRETSNDDASRLSGQELLARSGYKYQLFDAVAEDGYITQLTRIINPLAEPGSLRQPPLLMEHGGTIDPTAYLVASSIEHFPEPWPRKRQDGPMRSWNRSLAFQLANNGFDVWLAETRGSDGRRRIRTAALENLIQGKLEVANHTTLEQVQEVIQTINYWDFSQDDIISHEFKSHIDTVLEHTGSTRVNLMTFSLSTSTSLAFLGEHPDYAEKVHGYVSMAPIVSGEGTSQLTNLIFKYTCSMVSDEIGTLLLTDILFTQPFRELLMLVSQNKDIRYVLVKAVSTLLLGASPKWQTLLELNLIGHLFRELSFRELKQMCQQMRSNRLQKFDYGPVKNQLVYNQPQPPLYDISNLKIKDWIIVSGSNDALSSPKAIEHLISIVNPKPVANIVAPNFNHLDLFAGWENDIYVNEPIMRYFERMSHMPGETEAFARGLDLTTILPEYLHPEKFVGGARNISKTFLPANPLDARELGETLAKSLKIFVLSFTSELGRLIAPKLDEKPETAEDDKESGKDDKEDDKEADKKAEAKSPLDRMITGLRGPNFGLLTRNISSLIDPKKMMGNFNRVLNSFSAALAGRSAINSGAGRTNAAAAPMAAASAAAAANPFGDLLEGFKSLGRAGGEKRVPLLDDLKRLSRVISPTDESVALGDRFVQPSAFGGAISKAGEKPARGPANYLSGPFDKSANKALAPAAALTSLAITG